MQSTLFKDYWCLVSMCKGPRIKRLYQRDSGMNLKFLKFGNLALYFSVIWRKIVRQHGINDPSQPIVFGNLISTNLIVMLITVTAVTIIQSIELASPK